MKRLHTHKKHKNAYKQTKTKKAVLDALKKHLTERKSLVCLYAFLYFLCVKDNIFMRNKNVLEEESHLFTFCTFHAFCTFCGYKKHLSESRLFTFCTFCAFCAFCAYKKHLSESCLFAFCTFYAFCTFCVCEIFS